MSVDTVVLDPASLLINRKAKQRKIDRIDAKKMVRALLANDRGDSSVLSQVCVPTIDEEDRKRKLRERRRFVKERTSLTNSIKGLLKLQGIFDLNPRGKDFKKQVNEAETAYGAPFPAQASKEIFRILDRLQLAQQQIVEIEAEREEVVSKGAEIAISDTVKGSDEQAAAKIATLSQLKGTGANDATLLVNEIFYRDFRNRRELAGWVGIAPTLHASGVKERDQGIGGDGPG